MMVLGEDSLPQHFLEEGESCADRTGKAKMELIGIGSCMV
jgi:hypothetical protein